MHIPFLILCCQVLCTGGRVLSDAGISGENGAKLKFTCKNSSMALLGDVVDAWDPVPMLGSRVPESIVSTGLQGINRDWRPYFVLATGELLGYIVRSITGLSPLDLPWRNFDSHMPSRH